MNQALLAKQYWRICSNTNLLLTKTLKAKYSPQQDLHLHKPKKHSSWIWKSIMEPPNPILTQGTWKVGRGHDIPINHPMWFHSRQGASTIINPQVTRVADLINQDTATWKSDVVMQMYDTNIANKILALPLPKIQTQSTKDQVIWPNSTTGDYQVKRAYALLHQDLTQNLTRPRSAITPPTKIWQNLWRLKLPNKLLTFTWKLLHQALPVKTELNHRGIHCDATCILCTTHEETLNHLFLQCTFARAVWLGMGINTSSLIASNTTLAVWITNILEI